MAAWRKAIAGDAMADTVEAAEFLDVDVDELAGVFAFVAAHRLGRIEVTHTREPGLAQDAADGCRRQAQVFGDLLAAQALAAQGDDLLDHIGGRGAGHTVRT